MSEFEKEAEAAEILLAMQGKYQPGDKMDTEEVTVSTEEGTDSTEGNLNINQILFNIKNSSELAREVKQKSFKQLSSWVSNVSHGFDIIKNIVKQSVVDGQDLGNNYKDEIMKFGTNITTAYRKIEGNVEGGLENIGLKEQLDNIMLQHEKMLFIAMQLCYSKIDQEYLLEPNSEDIPRKVTDILKSEHKGQLMIHVNKLFETFYYGRLGVSAVNSYNIVETDQTIQGNIEGSYGFFSRSNKDLIDKYNTNEIKKIIDSTVENNEKLKKFLVHFIRNFNFDNTVKDIDHAKYFGYSQTLPEFVESIIDFNESNINFIDYELSKKSIKSRLDYYAERFNTGGSLPGYAKNIKDLYSNYKKLIDETEDFINDAKSKDFDNFTPGATFENDKETAKNIVKEIRKKLDEDYYNKFLKDPDGPIEKINSKSSEENVKTFLTEIGYYKEDESKKRGLEESSSQEQQSSQKQPSFKKKRTQLINEGGRKRKTRVAANKKRKTQKKKRPSRKMKVSRKKTQRRKKKGSKKKSMKNRK